MLVADAFIPFDDRSAGGRRTFAIMKLLRQLGWHVVFLARDGAAHEPFASRLRKAGIEVRPHRDTIADEILRLPFHLDAAWLCRPEVMNDCATAVRAAHGEAAVIYDTIDLHFVRLRREQVVVGKLTDWERVRDFELEQARNADVVVTTSSSDQDALLGLGIDSKIVPIIEDTVGSVSEWSRRSSVLFLGNYSHAPNVDAALRLTSEIMPLVWKSKPSLRLVLAGAEPPPHIRRLANERVQVPGYTADLTRFFDEAVIFAAPLRFGAGMKGKIVQSLAHGLPVITTAIGAEGIAMVDGQSGIIAGDAAHFSAQILRLARDEVLWRNLSAASIALARGFSPESITPVLRTVVESAIQARRLRAEGSATPVAVP